jgi:hypothetical protein
MPKPNRNFAIGLGVTITILLGLTKPKHLNTKILQASLFALNPSFAMESLLCFHMLLRPTTALKASWLVK